MHDRTETGGRRRRQARRGAGLLLVAGALAAGVLAAARPDAGAPGRTAPRAGQQLRAVLLAVEAIDAGRLEREHDRRVNAIVIDLAQLEQPGFAAATRLVRGHGFDLYYWVEVGHDRQAARDHPEWLHRPHKLAFYDEPVVIDGWVCINNRAVFDHELERVVGLARGAGLDGVRGILLNDVLGAPEGCGCGNATCRLWDGSPGEKISGGHGVTAFGDHPVAPRLFARRVAAALNGIEVIPVITEECEAGITVSGVVDPERSLGYGRMSCRNPCAARFYGRLIDDLHVLPRVGLLALYRTFGRDVPEYGPEGAWVGGIVERYRKRDPAQHLVAVLEGWDVTPAQVADQVEQALAAGAAGFVIVTRPLDQTWRVKPLRPKGKRI